jgi:hypothetical protein
MRLRTEKIEIRLTPKERAAWESKAKDRGVTISEFIRQQCRNAGRPKGAPRRPVVERCEHGFPLDEPCEARDALEQAEAEQAAAKAERIAAEAARWKAERERRQEAERLAKASGGVQMWYGKMSASDRQRWGDLESELLASEKRQRQQEKELARSLEPLTMDELDVMMNAGKGSAASKPALKPETPPTVPIYHYTPPPQALTGIIELDERLYPTDQGGPDAHWLKQRITGRIERQSPTQHVDSGAAGFDE